MYIQTMPEVLRWTDEGNVLDSVHKSYILLLSDSLGDFVNQLNRRAPDHADDLMLKLRSASDSAFLRVLTAPEVSFRLLWPELRDPHETGEFITRSLQAERARGGEPCQFDVDTWTALGDICFCAEGIAIRYPQVPSGVPLDFGSPYALAVDLGGPNNRPDELRTPFTSSEIYLVVEKIQAALAGINRVSPNILEFVNQFNKVLICQKDPAAPQLFSSGSTGQYVGRSFVTNPHLDFVDEVELAEALVHEGIHGLLYMQERLKPWFSDPKADRRISAVVSPWTGNRLSVRSYIQACFVWYGLAAFWAQTLTTSAFNAQRIMQKLELAVPGFLKDPLVDSLAQQREGISDDLVAAIQAMQAVITGLMAQTESDARRIYVHAASA